MNTIVRISRPISLLFAGLTYSLGVAVAEYLGESVSVVVFSLGLAWACLMQICMNFLVEVFRPANEPILPGVFGAERVYLRDRLLFISASLLVISVGCVWILFLSGRVTSAVLLLFAFSLLIVVAYAVPPIQMQRRGLGELLGAIHLGYVFPSLGFVLQAGDFHRLIPLIGLPLTAISIAYHLVVDFPVFAEDIEYERETLLTRIGWQRAIPVHHALIAGSFFLFALLPFAGVSLALIWPVFLAIPFAVLQILLLRGIGLGARPLWKPLMMTAGTLFALIPYLLGFSFLLR